jgi:hypothetical protein
MIQDDALSSGDACPFTISRSGRKQAGLSSWWHRQVYSPYPPTQVGCLSSIVAFIQCSVNRGRHYICLEAPATLRLASHRTTNKEISSDSSIGYRNSVIHQLARYVAVQSLAFFRYRVVTLQYPRIPLRPPSEPIPLSLWPASAP